RNWLLSLLILPAFGPVRFAGRDEAEDLVALAIAMADDQHPQPAAQSQQHEAVLLVGMFVVCNQERIVVEKDGARLVERDAVLAAVGLRLAVVPVESDAGHTRQV